MPKKKTATRSKVFPSAFATRARRVFESLPPGKQVVVLHVLGSMAEPKVTESRLLATDAQRQAALEMSRIGVEFRKRGERLARERVEIHRKWYALHNRAQARRNGRSYLTSGELKRAESMRTRLHEIEYKLGYAVPAPDGHAAR